MKCCDWSSDVCSSDLAWIQTLMAGMAGGRPVWKDAQLGNGWTKVNLEQIAVWDADRIFVVSYTGSAADVVRQMQTDPQWQAFRAVKQGKVYAFPSDYHSWDQSDTRWMLGLSWLACKMHPALFPGLDMDKEVIDFYRELYGMDEVAFRTKIRPVLKGDLP
jgi:iron complex transport system substrate-binding protein